MESEQAPEKRTRRQHDRAFKEELVRQSLEPGASVSALALRSGINANILFKWRREHLRATGLGATPTMLLPVQVAPQKDDVTAPAQLVPTTPLPKPASRQGVIELEIDGVQLRVRGQVDEASLCSVLRALRHAR